MSKKVKMDTENAEILPSESLVESGQKESSVVEHPPGMYDVYYHSWMQLWCSMAFVCPVLALIFESTDLESTFLVHRYLFLLWNQGPLVSLCMQDYLISVHGGYSLCHPG